MKYAKYNNEYNSGLLREIETMWRIFIFIAVLFNNTSTTTASVVCRLSPLWFRKRIGCSFSAHGVVHFQYLVYCSFVLLISAWIMHEVWYQRQLSHFCQSREQRCSMFVVAIHCYLLRSSSDFDAPFLSFCTRCHNHYLIYTLLSMVRSQIESSTCSFRLIPSASVVTDQSLSHDGHWRSRKVTWLVS